MKKVHIWLFIISLLAAVHFTTAQEIVEEEVVDISISKRGSIAVNQRLIYDADLESLISAITEVSGTKNTLPIVIRADAETPHQSVIMAMDAAGRLGFTKIKIATKHAQQ